MTTTEKQLDFIEKHVTKEDLKITNNQQSIIIKHKCGCTVTQHIFCGGSSIDRAFFIEMCKKHKEDFLKIKKNE